MLRRASLVISQHCLGNGMAPNKWQDINQTNALWLYLYQSWLYAEMLTASKCAL